MELHPDVQVALISGAVTIIVGIVTAIFAYKGAIKGAKTQIEHEKDLSKKQQEEQRAFTEKAIQQFIMREVKYNFLLIIENDFLMSRLEEPFPKQYGHGLKFRRKEFERFKHDLIKSKSELVERILLYYEVCDLLEDGQFLERLSQKEFDKVKEAVSNFHLNDYV